MQRWRPSAPRPAIHDVEPALAALSADDLRAVVREMLHELDVKTCARVSNALVDRAARGGSGWMPSAVAGADVAKVLDFVRAATRVGSADPSEVDEHLRRGTAAFLRRDYAVAHRIFGALLPPIGAADIDLGQDELVDEVLGVDVGECAARYVVAAYMIAPPAERAAVVRAAIDDVRGLPHFWEPIRAMERASLEPLPGLDDFLPEWRALIARDVAGAPRHDWDREEQSWLREVAQRLDGAAGLASLARSTRRVADLDAWCQALQDAGDWPGALAAFEEAAGLVGDDELARGRFLDGAALAAQQLGRDDLPERLERAWCAHPTMPRLRRWLGAAAGGAALRTRAASALEACPRGAAKQRALLHLLQGDFEKPAKLLAAAPGLGWSGSDHPGALLFPLFATLLGGNRKSASSSTGPLAPREVDLDELDSFAIRAGAPRLATPEVEQLLHMAGIAGVPDAAARKAVLAAMRQSAESRLAGVTEQQRRRRYAHAAELVAACVACDPSPATARWVASLRNEYRRFPALRAKLGDA